MSILKCCRTESQSEPGNMWERLLQSSPCRFNNEPLSEVRHPNSLLQTYINGEAVKVGGNYNKCSKVTTGSIPLIITNHSPHSVFVANPISYKFQT